MKKEIVRIRTELIKLDQLLKFAGVAETGSMAKEMILEGEVFLNGEPCEIRGKKIYPGDQVTVGDICYQVEKYES